MRQEQRKYEKEYKIQAVKLLKEIGARKTAAELGVPLHPVWMAESSTGGERSEEHTSELQSPS